MRQECSVPHVLVVLGPPDGGFAPNDFHRLKTQNGDEIVRVSLESGVRFQHGRIYGGAKGGVSPHLSGLLSTV